MEKTFKIITKINYVSGYGKIFCKIPDNSILYKLHDYYINIKKYEHSPVNLKYKSFWIKLNKDTKYAMDGELVEILNLKNLKGMEFEFTLKYKAYCFRNKNNELVSGWKLYLVNMKSI